MTYGYECDLKESDRCRGVAPDERPMLMAQFNEYVWQSTKIGGVLDGDGYSLADTITICGPCCLEVLD